MEARLINPSSFHPTLSLTIPQDYIPSDSPCKPNVLVHLPPGIFYDPYSRTQPQPYTVQHLTKEVELEQAVGWTGRRSEQKVGAAAEGEGGLSMQELLEDVLREKVEEISGEKVRVRRRKDKGKQKGDAAERMSKAEASSLMIELNVDELRAADGIETTGEVEVKVPLHLRYHPPSTPSTSSSFVLPSILSTYLGILQNILPSFVSSLLSLPASTQSDSVDTSIAPPQLVLLSCKIPGFNPTPLSKLFPTTHAHLLSREARSEKALALKSESEEALQVKVPVPEANWLSAVQVTTLASVTAAAGAVLCHLLKNVVPAVESVEKDM